MLLSHKTFIKVDETYVNIIGHMCYAAYKLWNVCNYERMHYGELSLPVKYPDWYYQKKAHKDDLWYRQLPSQTAQEVCKLLDKSWKSFYALKRSGGIENPQPPRFKNSNIPVTYMQNAVRHEPGTDTVRLSLPKQLKAYMAEAYGISETYLFLKNPVFKGTDVIKQIKLYPPEKGECRIIVIYEIPDVQTLPDNGRYMSIDLGLHNLMTCYNSVSGETFIIGRRYLSICSYFNKEISRIQSQWSKQHTVHGEAHLRSSKHILSLYRKKADVINDYLHKAIRYLISYCRDNQINTVVIGDISGIRKDNDLGPVTNQKLHSLPYEKLYIMLKYKMAKEGISLVMQEEQYTSQTSPLKPTVDKENAMKSNRVKRGLYRDGNLIWNADCVGAFNILRKYLCGNGIGITADPMNIKIPFVVKVAV